MGFFSRFCGIGAFSMAAGAAFNGVTSTAASNWRMTRHDDNDAFNTEYHKYRLGEVFNLAEDVAVFRFLLRKPETVFELPACSTLQCFQRNSFGSNAENIQRSYTPITPNGEKGYFDLLVKKQPHGRMTEALYSLTPGDYMQFRCRMYKISYRANEYKHIGLVAGGTGITPMLQVIRANIGNPKDKTKLTLCYGNQSEKKILLRGMLDELEAKSEGKLDNHFIIDKTTDDNHDTWKGEVGWMHLDWLYRRLPPAADPKSLVLMCGPDNMMLNLAGSGSTSMREMSGSKPMQGSGASPQPDTVGGVMGKLGYLGEQVFRF